MLCPKCHASIGEEMATCPECGAATGDDVGESFSREEGETVVYASKDGDAMEASEKEKGKERWGMLSEIPRPALFALAAIALVAIGLIVTTEVGKNDLKNKLVGTWYASDDSIIRILDIKSDTMTYELQGSYAFIHSTLGTWRWRPASKDTIEIDRSGSGWTTLKITSIDEYGFVVSPGLTSTDDMEVWVNPF